MTAAPSPLVSPSLLKALDLSVTAVLGLVLAIRPLCAGQLAAEPETAFLDALIWFAGFVWLLRQWLGREFRCPAARVGLPLAAFAVCVGLAVQRGWSDGNGQNALDLGLVWAADLMLFVIVLGHARQPERWRLLLGCLLAGLAVVAVYSLYQRGYGLDYFRGTIEANPASVRAVTGDDELQQRLYRGRVASDRVHGPFGYPNALAGYDLLLLPVLFGLLAVTRGQRARAGRYLLFLAGGLGLLAVVYSGSKAGFLAAKAVEVAALFLRLPRETRRPTHAWAMLAAVCLATVACAAAAGAGTWLLHRGFTNSSLGTAQSLFGLLWVAEVLYLGRLAVCGRVPGRWPVAGGSVLLASGVAVGLILWTGVGLPGPQAQGRLRLLRQAHDAIHKQVGVRVNYWLAALAMTADHPLRGVGLDNFGCRYTQYKRPAGWAVKRAHNHYLQLAADGGLPLLLSFVVVWLIYFRTRDRGADDPEVETPASAEDQAHTRLLGVALGALSFLLIYALFLQGLFMGLSVEFFFNELNALPGTGAVRAETGSWLPALVHGGTHFLLLPAVWIGTFLWVWRLSPGAARSCVPWLKLGTAGLLLHGFADFHLMNGSISTLLWAVAGLALAAQPHTAMGLRLRSAATWGGAGLGLLLFVALSVLVPMHHMEGVFASRAAEVERDILLREENPAERHKQLPAVLRAHAMALALRPRDGELYRHRADLLYLDLHASITAATRRPGQRPLPPAEVMEKERKQVQAMDPAKKEEILSDWRHVIACNPYFASGHAMYARRLLVLYPDDRAKAEEARASLQRAAELHPYKPLYRLELGGLCARLRQPAAAIKHLEAALTVDTEITDERAKLTRRQTQEARYLLSLLRAGRLPQ